MDIALLKANTQYSSCSESDEHIKLFWTMMTDRFTDVDRTAFLTFVWGRSRLPLTGAGFEKKFKITNHSKSAFASFLLELIRLLAEQVAWQQRQRTAADFAHLLLLSACIVFARSLRLTIVFLLFPRSNCPSTLHSIRCTIASRSPFIIAESSTPIAQWSPEQAALV